MGKNYFRKAVDAMEGYVPGFQPKVVDTIKLNTNENPYPPSPAVLEAIRAELARLRLYPDPTADVARQQVAKLHDVDVDNVIIGNGSDELLALAIRAFVDAGQTVSFPDPTYSLYEVLVRIQGAVNRPVPFPEDWSLPEALFGNDSPLTLLSNPNSPTGTLMPPEEVCRLADSLDGVLLVDEAYVDFAEIDCMPLVKKHPNAIVTRTLSKSYSLAGLRFGYAVASPELVAGLMKIKDSYNVDRLAIVGGAAALADQAHMLGNTTKIEATRARLVIALDRLGFETLPSQANFILTRPPGGLTAKDYFDALWKRLILIRWLDIPRVRDFVRISIGTDDETDTLLAATREILGNR
ncbi:MAG TPA: histidinol-phosphate transaminase [Planctomycetota bacterium]|nr:histidinol-phosphate transaminase [Planctomycetota bacterium]